MAPDLQMRILLENLDWDRAEQIARATQIVGAVPITTGSREFFFRRQPPSLLSWSIHDLLSDSADWGAETWDMNADELPRLVRTLEILFEQIPEEFVVEVMWVGDQAAQECAITREQLLDIGQQGKFGTEVRYRVHSALP